MDNGKNGKKSSSGDNSTASNASETETTTIAPTENQNISTTDFFIQKVQEIDFLTWVIIILHAYGGILVSLVIKYADSIVKAFATSISIVVTVVFSLLFFEDFSFTWGYGLGSIFVGYSVYMYSV